MLPAILLLSRLSIKVDTADGIAKNARLKQLSRHGRD
jgi:hypothetical protein